MKFKHAAVMAALKILGIHVLETLDGYHFFLVNARYPESRAKYIEDL